MNSFNEQNDPAENKGKNQVYTVKDISEILQISQRAAYNLCNSSTGFKVVRVGSKCIRIKKDSFDEWFSNLE